MKSMEELACEMVRLNARYRTGDSSAMEGIRALAWTAEVPVDFVVTLLDSDGTEEEIVIEMQSEIQSLRMKNQQLSGRNAELEKAGAEKQEKLEKLSVKLGESTDKVQSLEGELKTKSKRVQELEKAVATMEAGITRLEKENAELNDLLSDPEARIAALEAENAGLKAKAESLKDALDRMRDGTDASPVLIAGRETDLYEDEAKEILMDILKAAAGKMAKGTRRRDVIDSIMEANPVGGIPARNAGIVQKAMKGYRGMDPGVERALRETGIAFAVSGGNHVRLTYMDDSRYRVTLSSSTSDRRAGENAAADIVKQMF